MYTPTDLTRYLGKFLHYQPEAHPVPGKVSFFYWLLCYHILYHNPEKH